MYHRMREEPSARNYEAAGTVKVGYFPDREPEPEPEPPVTLHAVGLDLGLAQDFSALCVLEYDDVAEPVYHVRHLHRWSLGTAYTTIAKDVKALIDRPPLNWRVPLVPKPEGWREPILAVDATGCGRPVVEMIAGEEPAAWLKPVLITAGHSVSQGDDGYWHIAKVQLVSVLQATLQSGRLKIDAGLEFAGTLVSELKNFRVKITTSANQTFEAWREKDHDDLVLAVALSVWAGENRPQGVLDAWM
jgi:hypothetical protein